MSLSLALGAVSSTSTKPVLCQKPLCPCTGGSNINILHGCSPAFTLCPPKYMGFLWGYSGTTIYGEISTHANAAASANLDGEGIDSCATTAAWLSAWALLNPA